MVYNKILRRRPNINPGVQCNNNKNNISKNNNNNKAEHGAGCTI